MTAFDILIEHCNEKYPHFESPRGQADIAAAKAEYDALVSALQVLANIPIEYFNKQNKPDYLLMVWNDHELNVGHVLAARKALRIE